MIDESKMFQEIKPNDGDVRSITFDDNSRGDVIGLGKIAISNDMSISNVMLVESLNFNLLSIAQLCDLRYKCIFCIDDVEVVSVDGSNVAFKGFRYGNLC